MNIKTGNTQPRFQTITHTVIDPQGTGIQRQTTVTKPAKDFFMLLLLLSLFGVMVSATATAQPEKPAATTVLNTTVTAQMTEATVRKIDLAQAKITLKHAAIANIGMPAMTMVFKVADPAQLSNLQVNDQVLFSVEKQGTALVVTAIEKQIQAKIE